MVVEMVLEDLSTAGPLRAVSLRYFNAAGATDRRRERHDPETHLIPLALGAAVQRNLLKVFETDYPIPDGTAIRDYIHVNDLVSDHLLAIDYLRNGGGTIALNLGAGHGASVREVISTAEKVAGRPIDTLDSLRRAGDPAVLVTASDKARSILHWSPQTNDLTESSNRHGVGSPATLGSYACLSGAGYGKTSRARDDASAPRGGSPYAHERP